MPHQPFFPDSQAVLGYLEEVKAKVRRADSPAKLLEAINEFSDVMRVNTFFQSVEWGSKLAEARTSIQIELLAGLRSAATKIESLEQRLQGNTKPESPTPLFDSLDNPQTGTLSFPPTQGALDAAAPAASAPQPAVIRGPPRDPVVVTSAPTPAPSPVAQSIMPPPNDKITDDDILVHPDSGYIEPGSKYSSAVLWICRKCKRKHVGQPEGMKCEDCEHMAFKLVANPDDPKLEYKPETNKELAHNLQQMVDESVSETKAKAEPKSDQTELKFFTASTRDIASCDNEDCGSDNLQIEAPIPDHREQYTVKYRCLDCDQLGSFPCSKLELIPVFNLPAKQLTGSDGYPPSRQPPTKAAQERQQSIANGTEPKKRGRPKKTQETAPQSAPAAAQAPAAPARADFLTPRPAPTHTPAPEAPQKIKDLVNHVVQYDPPGVNPVSLRDAVLASMRSWPPEKLVQEWEALLHKIYDPKINQPDGMRQDIANFIAGVTTPGFPEPQEAGV